MPSKTPFRPELRRQTGHQRRASSRLFECCARLSKASIDTGINSTAIDWKPTLAARGAYSNVGSHQKWGQQVVTKLLKGGQIAYCHFAPPCGTASRARQIPIPAYLKQQGVHEPKPLRSELAQPSARASSGKAGALNSSTIRQPCDLANNLKCRGG